MATNLYSTALQEKSFRLKMKALLLQRFGKKDGSDSFGRGGVADEGDSSDLLAIIDEGNSNQKNEVEDVTIFGCLPPASNDENETKNLRGLVRDILDNVYYQRLILLCIVISCVVLVLDSPIPEYSRIDKSLAEALNNATFAIFVIEMVLKLLDRGIFWEHPQAYFRVGWNVLDFIVVLAQALDMSGLFKVRTSGEVE